MNRLGFNEYQEISTRTASKEQTYTERLANYALGLAGEGGEIADYIKKVVFHKHPLDVDVVKKELGDILWYASQMAETVGLTLEEVAVANVEKLKKRYPNGFSSEDSMKRVDTQ